MYVFVIVVIVVDIILVYLLSGTVISSTAQSGFI